MALESRGKAFPEIAVLHQAQRAGAAVVRVTSLLPSPLSESGGTNVWPNLYEVAKKTQVSKATAAYMLIVKVGLASVARNLFVPGILIGDISMKVNDAQPKHATQRTEKNHRTYF
jgi:hypothetical protein